MPLIRRTEPEKKPRIPARVTRLIGHVIAATIFAAIGYLIISHVRPDLFPMPFAGSSEQDEPKPADAAP